MGILKTQYRKKLTIINNLKHLDVNKMKWTMNYIYFL